MITPDRAWFDREGWRLDHDMLSSELQGRGIDQETRLDWLDEAADRRRDNTTPDGDDEQRARLLVAPAEYVLGALMLAGATGPDIAATVLEKIRVTGIAGPMFPRHRDRLIYAAIEKVVDQGRACEFMSVEAALTEAGALDDAGGPEYVRALARLSPVVSNAATYARLVVDEHRRAEQQRLALELQRAAQNGGVTSQLRDEILTVLEPSLELAQAPEAGRAGDAIFDEPTDVDAIRVWGDDEAVVWAAGEGLMLVGPDGVGKTTLGQQIAIARAGLRRDVLGMPVTPDGRRVLYIAADRPRQALRSMRRMVTETERDQLNDAMTIWRGPLPAMLNEDRTILTRLAKQFDAGSVVIDSMKDVAVDIAKDDAGGRIAAAFQHLIASGVELLVMHHPRKAETGAYHKPRDLQDTYGSRLIYGVFGSVVMLWGEPGDVLVDWRHLKQPIDEVGPFTIRHDHPHGKTTVERGTDLLDILLRAGTTGTTVRAAAELVLEKEDCTKNEIERIRQRLKKLATAGRVVEMPSIAVGGETRYLFNGPAGAFDQ